MAHQSEEFRYTCPHCSKESSAIDVANDLDISVLRSAVARRNALSRRNRGAGLGRPKLVLCPGCSQEMASSELRDHRIPCLRDELHKLRGLPILLFPKDPDPYPNFYINNVGDSAVEFLKGSNHDSVTVDLRKIAEVTRVDQTAHVRVLGRVVWHTEIKRWRFAPTGPIGRPATKATANHFRSGENKQL
jgi:hypothetical protein